MKNKYEIKGEITVIYSTFKGQEYQISISTEDLDLLLSFGGT